MRRRLAFAFLLCVTASPVALAAKRVDVAVLKASEYASVVATTDSSEFGFAESIGIWPGAIPTLMRAAKAEKRGAAIVDQYGLTDPAVTISRQLGEDLSRQLSVPWIYAEDGRASSPKMMFSLRDGDDLAKTFGPGKLVVDVRSMAWDAVLFGEDRFRIGYMAKAQIVDTRSGKVLASLECINKLKRKADAPLAATIFDNNAAALKAEFDEAGAFCLDMFRTKLLGLPVAALASGP